MTSNYFGEYLSGLTDEDIKAITNRMDARKEQVNLLVEIAETRHYLLNHKSDFPEDMFNELIDMNTKMKELASKIPGVGSNG